MMSLLNWAEEKEEREKAALKNHEQLCRLFKKNRFLFEIERKKMIADIIDSATDEEQKTKLRTLQSSWDKRMKSAGSEHNRYVLAQTFFWEHFHEKWHPAIKKLSQSLYDLWEKNMLNINAINTFELSKMPSRMNVHRSNFADQLSIMKADRLLQTTRQYSNWQEIRRNDPSRAGKIADLILERHAFIEGSAPRNDTGRNRFDHLTGQLKTEGIHLYKSHEFKNPIFSKPNTLSVLRDPISKGVIKTPAANVDTTVNNLRSRFEKKDCLEFLAGILEDSGIAYYGEKGMANTLVTKAINEGKNANAYLTGEGITHALCKNPVTIHVQSNSSDSFEDVWDKVKPHIKKGTILSFSSRTFGHTGIIDSVANRLTFLNSSGVKGKPKTYKVLAEEPKHEIRTWIQRARRKQTFLDITIGAIDSKLAVKFDNPSLATQGAPDQNKDLLTSQIVAQSNYKNG